MVKTKVKVYVEGGGDSKELHVRCREGFAKLTEKAGFAGRMPSFVACGKRADAFDCFSTSIADGDTHCMLLVDSEEPVSGANASPSSAVAWKHLAARDGWQRPCGAANDQAQMMVTCMETWIMADHDAVIRYFGLGANGKRLLAVNGLESRSRQDVLAALRGATKPCGAEKMYRKGATSFRLLAELDPKSVGALPHFKRFIDTLSNHL